MVTDSEEPEDVRVQVVVSGFFREGDPESHDPDFVSNVIGELHRIWINAELEKRGLPLDTPINQAIIIMSPEADTIEVRLNDEAEFVALAGEKDQVADPANVFVGHIRSLWPNHVDPDSAWSGYVTAQGGRVVVLDFRRNRERVLDVLTRATQFWRSAQLNLGHPDQLAPAVEDLHAAAELAVVCMALLEGWRQPKNQGQRHRDRLEWLRGQVRYGDVPEVFKAALERLAGERNVARYAERELAIIEAEASDLLTTVADMIEYARARRD